MKKLLFLVLFFAACSPAKKFNIVDVDARLAGLTGVRGEVVVENSGRRDLTVERAEFTLRLAGRKTATAVLVGPISVPARKVSRVDFRLRLTDVSLGAPGGLRLDGAEDVTVDVDGVARLAGGRKKIRLRNVPISQILSERRRRIGNFVFGE